jgi:DNA-binding NtrC family response regulator
MRVIVFADTPDLAQRAHEILVPLGCQITATRTLGELTAAIDRSVATDLLLAKLAGDAVSWEVAQVVRETAFAGRLLALVDHLAHPGTAHLTQVPRTRCVVRPPTRSSLDALLKQAASPLLSSAPAPSPSPATFYGMVGRSKQVQEIFSRIDKVAASDANVCIFGESGTGKELVSRALHYASPRRDQPFVTLDCTAIPEGLMESHLFGHVRGAFTGAVEQRDGVFSLANLGTLFIDELTELGLPLQAKLLRVIQTREFTKVGGSKPLLTNIRLITAMNKDPKRAVEHGIFREDLYYRVAVVMLRMPPLRERKEDIPLLIEHFLRRFSAAYHKPVGGVTTKALERLVGLTWPGNVRQLENFIEQAFVLAEGDVLTERDLFPDEHPVTSHHVALSFDPAPSRGPSAHGSGSRDHQSLTGDFEPGLPLHEVERRHILRTLEAVAGNRTKAATLLGISIRALQYKVKSYREEDAAAAARAAREPARVGNAAGADERAPASGRDGSPTLSHNLAPTSEAIGRPVVDASPSLKHRSA